MGFFNDLKEDLAMAVNELTEEKAEQNLADSEEHLRADIAKFEAEDKKKKSKLQDKKKKKALERELQNILNGIDDNTPIKDDNSPVGVIEYIDMIENRERLEEEIPAEATPDNESVDSDAVTDEEYPDFRNIIDMSEDIIVKSGESIYPEVDSDIIDELEESDDIDELNESDAEAYEEFDINTESDDIDDKEDTEGIDDNEEAEENEDIEEIKESDNSDIFLENMDFTDDNDDSLSLMLENKVEIKELNSESYLSDDVKDNKLDLSVNKVDVSEEKEIKKPDFIKAKSAELSKGLKEIKEVKEVRIINEVSNGKEKTSEKKTMTTYNNTTSSDMTYITEGTTIKGNIETSGSIEIDGIIEGDVKAAGELIVKGSVTGNVEGLIVSIMSGNIRGNVKAYNGISITEDAYLIGDIEAGEADIAGAVKGKIDVNGPVVLECKAKVLGDIDCKSVEINGGAVIEGKCSQKYADVSPSSFFENLA